VGELEDPVLRRRLAAVAGAILLALTVYAGTFLVSYGELFRTENPLVRSDVARLSPARQLHRAYPNARHAFERKRFYDPGELFTSQFYEKYGHSRER
jgi:hypothetical protein